MRYESITKKAILKKVNRNRKPVSSLTQLAKEFRLPVYGEKRKSGGPAVSGSFREHVYSQVGSKVFKH